MIKTYYKTFASLLLFVTAFTASAVSKDSNSTGSETALNQFKSSIQSIEPKNSPYDLVQHIGEHLFDSVQRAQNIDVESSAIMPVIVEKQLMPFVDVTFASYKILGTQLKKSTKQERQLFVEAMEISLVNTYSSALAQYSGQDIKYEPHQDVTGKKMVSVGLELLDANKPSIKMVFKLRKNKRTQQWKAFDLIVEGISLVDSKRAELSRSIRQQGIEHVAKVLMN
jgi:phospholipid transport system substrate-binding protein